MLQVQRDQQDAQQFWLALLDAVRHASAAAGRAGPPAATPDFNAPAMVDRVLSELADARDGGITLVIDDLHELTSREALAQLARLLTDLPLHVHVILTTRHDLRLGLHQLRLAGELTKIRAADLRFTERETRELLAGWFLRQGQVVDAIRHTQAAGDWADAARLLADQSFSLTLDGQAQTVQALVRAFPPGSDHPELALVRAMDDAQGRLDEAALHLAVAEAYVRTTPPDRRRRLGVVTDPRRCSVRGSCGCWRPAPRASPAVTRSR